MHRTISIIGEMVETLPAHTGRTTQGEAETKFKHCHKHHVTTHYGEQICIHSPLLESEAAPQGLAEFHVPRKYERGPCKG